MALKDYRWQLAGENLVYPDLKLNNPIFRIIRVDYDVVERKARIEISFTEGNGVFEHRRDYYLNLSDGNESLSGENVALFIAARFPNAALIQNG